MLIDPKMLQLEICASLRVSLVLPTLYRLSSQGGSYIKGTDTQGCSEIDIVLFSDVFAEVNHCKKRLTEGLDALRENLKQTSHGNRSG